MSNGNDEPEVLHDGELGHFVLRILRSLFILNPEYFSGENGLAGLSHRQAAGLFLGDSVVNYVQQRQTPEGWAVPDFAYLKQLQYENIVAAYGASLGAITAAADQSNMEREQFIANMIANVTVQYLQVGQPLNITHGIPAAHAAVTVCEAGAVNTANQLYLYVLQQIPNFNEVRLLGEGVAHHYTDHADELSVETFRGAEVSPDLDRTQDDDHSPAAEHDPGVVFGYPGLADSQNEGGNSQVMRLGYSAAVEATHETEANLDYAPPTILIINRELVSVSNSGDQLTNEHIAVAAYDI
ncbi:MAG: hypothetical protein H8E66_00285, partial [Planctomycetes bacterium]|nr:hypothetical protein [Planctomycetota bacterium]